MFGNGSLVLETSFGIVRRSAINCKNCFVLSLLIVLARLRLLGFYWFTTVLLYFSRVHSSHLEIYQQKLEDFTTASIRRELFNLNVQLDTLAGDHRTPDLASATATDVSTLPLSGWPTCAL